MKPYKQRQFANGIVYALQLEDGLLIETTDTHLPVETINAIGRRTNALLTGDLGSRNDRWMIGVSTMVGCYVGCKFCNCAGRYRRKLTAEEMVNQVRFVVDSHQADGFHPQQFRILFTRMGDPGGNMDAVIEAMRQINQEYASFQPVFSVSTVGLNNHSVEDLLAAKIEYGLNVELQFSIHTTNEDQRTDLMNHFPHRLSFAQISDLIAQWMAADPNGRRVTLNFTLVEGNEFDIEKLKALFSPDQVFIKLSPLNENRNTNRHAMQGIIKERNLA